MKIAIITDVHGNVPALKAVLDQIDELGDIEHIYCLGDMIAIGPDTNEVLEMLFQREDVSMITGNHDEAVLALVKGEEYPLSHRDVYLHHTFIAKRIEDRFIEPLSELPRHILKVINGKRIFFTHYFIPAEKKGIHISQDPFASIVEPGIENLEKLFEAVEADLICFGHHHPVHLFKGAQKTFLNPGSLGCSRTPAAKYSTVTVSNDFNIEMKEAKYDNRDFLLSYERLKVPSREFILEVFHGNQHMHI